MFTGYTTESFKEAYNDYLELTPEGGTPENDISDEDFIKFVRFNSELLVEALKIAAGV